MKNKQGHIRTFSRKIVGWFHHILHLRHILHHGIYNRQNHLAYLETHLTHHCNLNCIGCGHFSPLSPKKFTEYNAYRRDMMRLKEILPNIGMIRLMGGEPLLHPLVSDFLRTRREAFPRSDIRVVTNGILIPQMPEEFWQRCSDDRIILDLTRYPISIDIDAIRRISTKHCVSLNESEPISRFLKFHLDLRGDSEPEKVFRQCRQQYYRRLFVCAAPALSHLLSDQFGDRLLLSNKDFICIDDITARDIIDYLSSPIPSCRFCTTDVTPYRWTTSKREREEWLE